MKIDHKRDIIWIDNTNDLAFVSGKDPLTIIKELLNFDGDYHLFPMLDYFYDAPLGEQEHLVSAIVYGYTFVKSCICHGATSTFDVNDGDDGIMKISEDELIMEGDVNYEYLTSFIHKINYCPICGRSLKEG